MVVLTLDSADKVVMSTSVAVRANTWLRTAYRKEVCLEVMLSLGLIHRMQENLSLLRGIGSNPLRAGRIRRSRLMWS